MYISYWINDWKGIEEMYYMPAMYSYPNYPTMPMYSHESPNGNWAPNEWGNDWNRSNFDGVRNVLTDYGAKPFVVNINEATK